MYIHMHRHTYTHTHTHQWTLLLTLKTTYERIKSATKITKRKQNSKERAQFIIQCKLKKHHLSKYLQRLKPTSGASDK